MDSKQLVTAAQQMLAAMATAKSEEIRTLLERGEYANIQSMWCDPNNYGDSESYLRDAQCVDLFRKSDFLPGVSSRDRDDATFLNWLAAEKQCTATNVRFFQHLPQNDSYITPGGDVFREFITLLRKDVRYVMGKCPVEIPLVFTNGATSSDRTGYTFVPDKINSQPVCYTRAYNIARDIYNTSWGRHLAAIGIEDHLGWEFRDYNEYFTVPKDALKNRACCKEANTVIPYQRGVGQLLSKRLTSLGWDIPSGQDRHIALAKHASIFGDYATIDMSSGSDTIAYNFVKAVVSPSWFDVLDSLRAQKTKVKGRMFVLEKFSSMGNGFTFELETILFGCIGRVAAKICGCNPNEVTCYGDDLIVPTACAKLTTLFLEYCGFTLNRRKTFISGPFRESCGGDFFRGINVTTAKIKTFSGSIPDIYVIHNMLKRSPLWEFSRFGCSILRRYLPFPYRSFGGPVTLGDSVLHGVTPRKTKRNKWGSLMCRGISQETVSLDRDRWDQSTIYHTLSFVTYPVILKKEKPLVTPTWYDLELSNTYGLPSVARLPDPRAVLAINRRLMLAKWFEEFSSEVSYLSEGLASRYSHT